MTCDDERIALAQKLNEVTLERNIAQKRLKDCEELQAHLLEREVVIDALEGALMDACADMGAAYHRLKNPDMSGSYIGKARDTLEGARKKARAIVNLYLPQNITKKENL